MLLCCCMPSLLLCPFPFCSVCHRSVGVHVPEARGSETTQVLCRLFPAREDCRRRCNVLVECWLPRNVTSTTAGSCVHAVCNVLRFQQDKERSRCCCCLHPTPLPCLLYPQPPPFLGFAIAGRTGPGTRSSRCRRSESMALVTSACRSSTRSQGRSRFSPATDRYVK